MTDLPTLGRAPDVPLDQVEWRVDGPPTEGQNPRARFVPYIGAATVAALLDEWVGPAGWADTYEVGTVGGKEAMWCRVSVRTPAGDWITKTDIGAPTNFEGQKGAVSDSFKRAACLKWGVGRNVYQLPTLWAPCRAARNRKGEPVAYPIDATLPALLADLRRLGYGQVEGGRLEAPDEETGEVTPPASPAEPPATSPPPAPAGPTGAILPSVAALKSHAVTKELHAAGLDTSGSIEEQRVRLSVFRDGVTT